LTTRCRLSTKSLRAQRKATVLSVITWNVNGIRARQQELLDLIERERPDVICLQEIKASAEHVPAALVGLADYYCYWHGHKGYSGVALQVSRTLSALRPSFAHPSFDHETRIVTVELGPLILISVYVPNGGKDFPAKERFLNALDEYAEQARASGKQLILCGDLNVAREPRDVHPSLRKPEQIGQTPSERAQLERVIGRELVDLSRQFQPDEDQLFTWWAPWRNMKQKNIGWRLDYVLCNRELAERAVECRILREFGTSDHAPVLARFDLPLARVVPTPEAPQPAPKAPQLELF
jgi:exodeoxyribonuclease III